jgi:LSD1 subclass zinc finger protein
MIDRDLLDILVCPVCKGPLSLEEEASRLVCAGCNVGYPIEDGIPNLLPDAGRPLGEVKR